MPTDNFNNVVRMPLAGFLSWVIPGLGHFYLGDHVRGLIFLVTIMATFWSGVAIGGVASTVNPQEHKLWFMAQACTGGNSLAAYALTRQVVDHPAGERAAHVPLCWMSADVGIHYTGVAGLLNLLIILDALGRADPAYRYGRGKRAPPEAVS